MIGIYKITNKLNNKSYIGQSIDIEKRFQKHKSTAFWKNSKNLKYDYPLYQAFRKYGIENFYFEVLEECLENELNEKEQYYYELFKPNYCLTEPVENVVLNKQVREKISKALKGKTPTLEHRQNIRNALSYDKSINAKKVKLQKEKECHIFNSNSLAAKWLIENGYSNSNNERRIAQSVARTARKERKTLYGFTIDYL